MVRVESRFTTHPDTSPRSSASCFLRPQDVSGHLVRVYLFSVCLMIKDNVRKTCTVCRLVMNHCLAAQHGVKTNHSCGFVIDQEEEAGAPTTRNLASSALYLTGSKQRCDGNMPTCGRCAKGRPSLSQSCAYTSQNSTSKVVPLVRGTACLPCRSA